MYLFYSLATDFPLALPPSSSPNSPLFPSPLPLFHFCFGKDMSSMSVKKTWYIKLQ